MLNQDSFALMRACRAEGNRYPVLKFDLKSRDALVEFQLNVSDQVQSRRPDPKTLSHDYMMRIPLGQFSMVSEIEGENGSKILVLSLESPPIVFKKVEDGMQTHDRESRVWSETDLWYRQTDIVHQPQKFKILPVALRKANPVIDIGMIIIELGRNSC